MHRWFFLSALLFAVSAQASGVGSLEEEIVGEQDPTAFAPVDWNVGDFALLWKDGAPDHAEVRLLPGSLQWVRVSDVLVLPRALVELTFPAGAAASIKSNGRDFSLTAAEDGRKRTVVMMPLLNGASSSVEVSLPSRTFRLESRFRPRKPPRENVLVDSSCSRQALRIDASGLSADSWAYVGCRPVRTVSEGKERSALEVSAFLYDETNLNLSPHKLLLTRKSPKAEVSSKYGSLVLEASLPEVAHRAKISGGLGPYALAYDQGSTHTKIGTPLATLYGSYVLAGTNRIALFSAASLNRRVYTDSGAYFQFESFKALDQRVSFQLLIGAHAFSYHSPEANLTRINLPQGFEIYFHDLLGRGCDAAFGGFLQPSINGKEYYNTWLRWGPTSFFLEINYIYTSEQPDFVIRTYGLTAGLPLASLF